jgi:hypothetical protein
LSAQAERERILAILREPGLRDEWINATYKTVGTFGNVIAHLIKRIEAE